jgi:hypothetical protein
MIYKNSHEPMVPKPREEELGGYGQLRSKGLPQSSDWQHLS